MDMLRLPTPLRALVCQQIVSLQQCRRLVSTASISETDSIPLPPLPKLTSELFQQQSFNQYITTTAPTPTQLQQARQFWTKRTPSILFSHPTFHALPQQSPHPEVAFFGRSNVGKSSILNALFQRNDIAHESKKPGKTRLMNGYGVSPHALSAAPQTGKKGDVMRDSWNRMRGGLMVVDMPGYGAGSRREWGAEIMKYLQQRKQLRRAFLLVDTDHGLLPSDLSLLQHLFRAGVQHSIVLSKADKYLHPRSSPLSAHAMEKAIEKLHERMADIRGQLKKEIWSGRDAPTEIFCTSSTKSLPDGPLSSSKIGINELRWAAMTACGISGVD